MENNLSDDFIDIAFAHKKLFAAAALQSTFTMGAYGAAYHAVLKAHSHSPTEMAIAGGIFMFLYASITPVDREYIKTVFYGERHGFWHYALRMFAVPVISFALALPAVFNIYLPMLADGRHKEGFAIAAAIMAAAFAIAYFIPWGLRSSYDFVRKFNEQHNKTYRVPANGIIIGIITFLLIIIAGIGIISIMKDLFKTSEIVSVIPVYMLIGLFLTIVYPQRCANVVEKEKSAAKKQPPADSGKE